MMYSGKCLLPYRNLYWVVGCLGTWFKKKNYFRTCRTWPSCEPKTSSSHWKCQLYPIAKEICEERRQKDTGTALGRIYLSQRPGVLLDQACSEGHTTFRNSPLEEILGQGRQHLAETGREGDFILSDSLTGFCGTSVWTLFDHLDDPVKPPPPWFSGSAGSWPMWDCLSSPTWQPAPNFTWPCGWTSFGHPPGNIHRKQPKSQKKKKLKDKSILTDGCSHTEFWSRESRSPHKGKLETSRHRYPCSR